MEYNFNIVNLNKEAKELVNEVDKNINLYGYKELEKLRDYIENQPKETYEDAKKYYCGYKVLKTMSFLVKNPDLYLLCYLTEEARNLLYYNNGDWARNLIKKLLCNEITADEIIFEYNRSIGDIVYCIFRY